MRSLKLLGVAACVAAVALTCSAAASADRVCKAKEPSCVTSPWPVGTAFEAKIKSGTKFTFDGFRHYTCTISTRKDTLTSNQTLKGLPVNVGLVSETFDGCTSVELGNCTAEVSGFPSSINWYANSGSPGDGTVGSSSTAQSITFKCTGLTCKWLYGTQTAHTYKGGSPAIEYLKANYARDAGSSMFCGTEVVVEGEREIFSPSSNPVYWYA